MTMRIAMTVNGTEYAREVEPRLLLIHFLRDELGLTGSHWGCDTSNCGSCVVWLDQKPVNACTVLAAMADGHCVRTVEDLERDGRLDPVQEGFIECHGLQCGFCTPGMMMTARWLLDHHPDPSEAEIREAISGQICRCTGYGAAVKEFNDRCGCRGVARGAVVLIISDGWETGDPELLGAQMARLSRVAHRIVWANPRTQSPRYRPEVGGMAAAWPYCDAVVSAHNLDALGDLLSALQAR